MKIAGMMLLRNEDWILNYSARVALRWCDDLCVILHNCTDDSEEIIKHLPAYSVSYQTVNSEHWDEMELRQSLLEMARHRKATHMAIIDADEVLTANNYEWIRRRCKELSKGELLELPMLAGYFLGKLPAYRKDDSVWSNSILTTAFADSPDLHYSHRDGYQHHNRPPANSFRGEKSHPKTNGGVIHWQWADPMRLRAKHVWYRMMEKLRWPGRESSEQLNKKYDQALDLPNVHALKEIPSSFIDGTHFNIKIGRPSWHLLQIRCMIEEHGIEKFDGLDLKEFYCD